MNYSSIYYLLIAFVLLGCKKESNTSSTNLSQDIVSKKKPTQQISDSTFFKNNPEYISQSFDFPVGKPNAKGYYNAQKFTVNNHLGDDWNGVGGGNTDLGDNIYAISNGYITEVKDYGGGWGNVIRINHFYKNKLYQSLYAHCDTIIVLEKTFIKKGDKIATIGNCNGNYYAHLHFEIRDNVHLGIGGGYSENTEGYLDPTVFIKNNRATSQR